MPVPIEREAFEAEQAFHVGDIPPGIAVNTTLSLFSRLSGDSVFRTSCSRHVSGILDKSI